MNKKIAVIGLKGLPAFGGAASVGESIVHELQHAFDFTVYSVSSHTDATSGPIHGYRQIVFRKSRIRRLNTFSYFLRSLFHVLFVKRYDLIHVHHGSSGFIIPLLRLKYKVVVTFHGIYREETVDPKFNYLMNRSIAFSQRLNLRYASQVISVSRPDTDYLNRSGKWRPVAYIPNGVSLPEPEAATEFDTPYSVFAANRVYDIKGLHVLLEAMQLNGDKRKLLVIGDRGHNPEYSEKIDALAAGLNVVFTGLIKDKNRLFGIIAKAELFIFPSLTEAMSMMLLEVASLGVPVIASDIEANRAVFTENEVTFFRSENAQSLAEQLLFCYEHSEALREKALAALHKVRSEHRWPVIAEQYTTVFNRLMGPGNK